MAKKALDIRFGEDLAAGPPNRRFVSFDVLWEYDTADKSSLEAAESQSEVLYPLFSLEEEIQRDLQVWASFVCAYQKRTEEYGQEWSSRRQQKLEAGLPDDGTVDGEVFDELGLPDDAPVSCSPTEVREWALRWLEILGAMSEEQDEALFWQITARLLPTAEDQETRWRVPDGAVARVKGEAQADLEKVRQQAADAESRRLCLLCYAGLG